MVRVVGFCVCWREAVEIFVGFMFAVELILIDSLRLQASGFRLQASGLERSSVSALLQRWHAAILSLWCSGSVSRNGSTSNS